MGKETFLDDFSSRRPSAQIVFVGTSTSIVCEAPSCRFHFESGCVNPEVMIDDDCPMDQRCLTWEPRELSSGND